VTVSEREPWRTKIYDVGRDRYVDRPGPVVPAAPVALQRWVNKHPVCPLDVDIVSQAGIGYLCANCLRWFCRDHLAHTDCTRYVDPWI